MKEVQEAGRWKSIDMPAKIYGHLERSKVDDDARQLGEEWYEKMMQKGDVISPDFRANSGLAKSVNNK